MKCINHDDRDAFGVCTTCHKGLCKECLIPVENFTVCKDSKSCKEKVLLTNSTFLTNKYTVPILGGLSACAGILSFIAKDYIFAFLLFLFAFGCISANFLYLNSLKNCKK